MTKTEMLERSRKALADFRRLPPAEQFEQLVQWGVIDRQGEVLFARHDTETQERQPFNEAEIDSPSPARRGQSGKVQ